MPILRTLSSFIILLLSNTAFSSTSSGTYSHTFELEAVPESDLDSFQSVLWWGLTFLQANPLIPTASELSLEADGVVIACNKNNGEIACSFAWEDTNPDPISDILDFGTVAMDRLSPQLVIIQSFFVYVQAINPLLPYETLTSASGTDLVKYKTSTAEITLELNHAAGEVAVKIEKTKQ